MKNYFIVFFILGLFILGCSKDEEEAASGECLVCDNLPGDFGVTQAELNLLCVGATGEDPETGESLTLTREVLDTYVNMINAFGALAGTYPGCRVE
tara:strand:+ start:11768 stop:12055 length:288 start_codon:yes stop_codon:yes gene_type:complete